MLAGIPHAFDVGNSGADGSLPWDLGGRMEVGGI